MSANTIGIDEVSPRAARRAAWFWGSLVVTFLGLQVTGGIFAIYLATGDPTVAIVPDYHSKALAWDQEIARRDASDRLQWKSTVQIGSTTDVRGFREIKVMLLSRSGLPVVDAEGQAKLYHHARANEVQLVPLVMQESGVYVGNARMGREGLWQIELDLHLGTEDHFVSDQTIRVTGTSAGGAP